VVDVANVMGARPDGWWRDRPGAALRLGREVLALARRGATLPGNGPAGAWVLVVEGQARAAVETLAAETLAAETLATETLAVEEATPPAPPLVRIVSAPGSGDDAIVGVAADIIAGGEFCLVVTADRGLRQRCEELNAAVIGPGWLLRLLLKTGCCAAVKTGCCACCKKSGAGRGGPGQLSQRYHPDHLACPVPPADCPTAGRPATF
jgi:hypothetical protein